LIRKQIELFEALQEDVDAITQGRVRQVVLGQVGIRCRHCALLPPGDRKRGAFYYPSKLNVVYQVRCACAFFRLYFSSDRISICSCSNIIPNYANLLRFLLTADRPEHGQNTFSHTV
jgi:hypothetical protein